MRKKLLKIVLHIFGVILFISATAYALLAAYGYQIDLLHQNIVKTSIIDVASKVKDAEIYIDNKLVSDKAPYQAKNLKPGLHSIEILKEGYTKWSRKVTVIEDLVTKIDDVLLFPLDLEPYLYNLKHNIEYSDYLFNNEYLVFISEKQNQISIHKIIKENLQETGTINLVLNNPEIFFVDDYRLAIQNEENITIIDLRDSSARNIQLPDEFTNLKLSYNPDLTGYYLNNNSIFKVSISEEGTFNEIAFLNDENTCYEDFEIISSYDHVFIKCNQNLFEEYNNNIELIDDSISLIPEISNDGQNLLYLNNKGEIVTYNIYLKEKELLARFYEDIESIKWHYDSKHIYIYKNKNLLLCDLDFTNCNKIFDQNPFINTSKPIYTLVQKNNLAVFDLSEVL